MTGLVIKLKPNEKVLVNGVLLQNGDRAARIRVRSSDVSILRARDAIPKEEANTPLKRVYYIAQLALAGEADSDQAVHELLQGLNALKGVFPGEAGEDVLRALKAAQEKKFFVVMRALKRHFEFEEALLQRSPAMAEALAS
ncbi:flagellar biosynthesis repressor FlbT [Hyphococcus luteus]|uniref:Flagellar biosynthesis repressor FlbT n=1 Tax=Hyphococcus luteus TaxID=2058213 RepID=A0A2S7K8M6_9PROT|nr:flagellar biosynthesis repressor FlbT [Marinicaulis flavus]PQA88864.1 flagellar biosynthesis repressor FlbT [Marinicaulis flavus]